MLASLRLPLPLLVPSALLLLAAAAFSAAAAADTAARREARTGKQEAQAQAAAEMRGTKRRSRARQCDAA